MHSAEGIDRQIKKLLQLYETYLDLKRTSEGFDNINRMKPVRLNVAGSASGKKRKKPDAIQTDQVSVPTEAEMDFYQGGLQLPTKSENIQKLLADLNRTGKFDYELCYLLRKQEAQDDLKDWMRLVTQRRAQGDEEFGKEGDALRFNMVMESSLRRFTCPNLFRQSFIASLQND